MNRASQIIRTSVIGIIANVMLAAFKATVGVLASSVAIVMDAVNNLSDALSGGVFQRHHHSCYRTFGRCYVAH